MLNLGWTVARFIYGMSWKAVQKTYPKVSKKVFNQIKKYKNKKNLKKAFDKKESSKSKITTSKSKPTTTTAKSKTKPKKDRDPEDFDPKIKGEGPPPPTWWQKEAGQWRGMWTMIPAGLRQSIRKAGSGAWRGLMLDFKPFSAIPGPVSRKIAKAATYGAIWPGPIGGMVTGGIKKGMDVIGGKGMDINTGTTIDEPQKEGTKIDAPTTGIAGTDDTGAHMNAFINAHNSALQAGNTEFEYAGRTYTVGTVPMQNF